MLTRFADCVAAFSDWQTWSSQQRGNLLNDMPQRIGKTLGTTDPPRHTTARKLVNKAFTPRTVAVLEPTIRAHARALAASAREQGTFEYVHDIAAPLNANVLGAMFGMSEDEVLRMRPWLDDFFTREPAPRTAASRRTWRPWPSSAARSTTWPRPGPRTRATT